MDENEYEKCSSNHPKVYVYTVFIGSCTASNNDHNMTLLTLFQ